ncbi:tetraacyldisaccharide 4'-kinase [Amnimonas aquatica]|uniref:Tetraacyldisaccharide 4'-kinase n=1 Tax=Amnimonas aquatica TaxID=2094561 RepID=A0A2P6ASB6_9GAMM|nr:tetraacyldisaccharide 4'-kinase [Amnimonas aquatica]PQA42355.1 tetraacyldisaccharide 4'-kinase [Amnimonas aquatica]
MASWAERWHDGHPLFRLLLPLGRLFEAVAARRRAAWRDGRRTSWRAPVPVIVVGNITVGGTGKTPLTLALVEQLRAAGWRPGIVSRGYGGRATYPCLVLPDADAAVVGDEPLLLARRSGVPVVVDPQRARGVRHLLAGADCDLVICDDGLQHYALARDIEIAVIDGRRGLGSGLPLPAGPLREPPSRLAEVDFRVINGDWLAAGEPPAAAVTMLLEPGEWLPVATAGSTGPVAGTAIAAGAAARSAAAGQAPQPPARVHAVAGIGHPPRFFAMLAAQGYAPVPHAFPDHHAYRAEELRFTPPLPLVMTEKDAVKCAGIAPPDSWFVPVQAMLPADFWQALHSRLADWRPSDA